MKEFHIFSSCCSCCLLGIWTLFPRALCFWQPLAPVCCESPRMLLGEFPFFPCEKWTRISLQFTLGYLNIISMSSIWQSPRASVYRAFGRTSHIFIVLVVSASLRSSHLKIWTLFLLAVIWWCDGFFGGFDAFFALLRLSRS